MQLSSADLNLLVVLQAVLEERSVVRAAKRVSLSPSATSHALARLRDTLGDPLVVKTGRTLALTPRGEALLPQVRRALAEAEAVFRTAPVDPARLARAFRLATTDHVQLVLLPAVDALLVDEAPGVDVFCVPMGTGALPQVRAGEADLALGVYESPGDEFARVKLFDDELVTVCRAGHPAGPGPWTLDDFAAQKHVLVAPNGSPRGLVDRLLAEHGRTRRVARTLPTFVDAAWLLSVTDAVAALPRRLVDALAPRFGLVRVDVPLKLPRFAISAVWHQRTHADPEHRWFRLALARAAGRLG